METQHVSQPAVEKLKRENDTLRKRIQTLLQEVERLRKKLESTWGEA